MKYTISVNEKQLNAIYAVMGEMSEKEVVVKLSDEEFDAFKSIELPKLCSKTEPKPEPVEQEDPHESVYDLISENLLPEVIKKQLEGTEFEPNNDHPDEAEKYYKNICPKFSIVVSDAMQFYDCFEDFVYTGIPAMLDCFIGIYKDTEFDSITEEEAIENFIRIILPWMKNQIWWSRENRTSDLSFNYLR